MNEQDLKLEMHPNLLLDVIKRQAGTLGKAILELVMNAVDAKATTCHITLDTGLLQCIDNGTGFTSEEQWHTNFKVFGEPHKIGEQKIYGTFRMGRGQAFSYGVNRWSSGHWMAHIDINRNGLGGKLHRLETPVQGCNIAITLYNELSLTERQNVIDEVKKLCRWMGVHGISVQLNGEEIALDPRTQPKKFWDHETDKCWVRFVKTGGFSIYNMGAYVRDKNDYHFGSGGECVSKVGLRVNFARNDVMSDDPVWKQVQAFVSTKSDDRLNKSKSLDDAGRQRLARAAMNNTGRWYELRTKKLLTDVCGKHHSIGSLENVAYRYQHRISAAPQGYPAADTIHQTRLAFVLANHTLDRFGVGDVETLIQAFKDRDENWCRESWDSWRVTPLKELTAGMDINFNIVPPERMTPKEQMLLELCRHATQHMAYRLRDEDCEHRDRRFVLGVSDVCNAWTDGKTYIAVCRKYLAGLDLESIATMHKLCHTLIHEWCHDEDTQNTHVHDREFYDAYHAAASDLGIALERMMQKLPVLMAEHKKKLTRKHMKMLDRQAASASAAKKLAGV